MSGGLEERTASEVHATLCQLVTTNAAAHPAWSEYAAVLLSPASASFFEARLSDGKAEADSNPPSKKRKAGGDADESDAPAAEVICEHCGGAVPLISLRVACMDGTTLDVTVPQRGLVREVKRSVGQVRGESSARHGHAVNSLLVYPTAAFGGGQLRDVDPGLTELFVDGTENALPDSGRLHSLGLGEGSVVFMLQRLGWRWTASGSGAVLSEEGLVATNNMVQGNRPHVTGGEPMTEGRHYWEVQLTKWASDSSCMLGAMRPGLDHDKDHCDTNDVYFIDASDGCLWGTVRAVMTCRASSCRATASACCSTSTPVGCGSTVTGSGAGRATQRG
jgi:hypothetical protein